MDDKYKKIIEILLEDNFAARDLYLSDAEFRADVTKLVHMLEPCVEWFVVGATERRRSEQILLELVKRQPPNPI